MRAKIVRELASGRHAISEPVPPQREWARRLGVSSFTVQSAFEALKREGIVEACKGSYTFLRRLPADIPLEEATRGPKPRIRISLWLPEPKDLRWMRKSLLRQRFTKRFHSEHPDMEVEERLFDLPFRIVEARILASIMREANPVVSQIHRSCLDQLVEHEALAPISEPDRDNSYLEQLHPRWLHACTVGGALRLLPTVASCSFLFYNKEHFRSAGLDPEIPPRDWTEFLAAARALKASRGGLPSFHLLNRACLAWWLMQLAYQAMPRLEREDDRGMAPVLPPVDWLGAAARQALEFYIELRYREKVVLIGSEPLPTMISQCLRGELPMIMGDPRLAIMAVQLKQAHRFGIAAMPAGPNGRTISMLNCVGWVLNGHALPEQQQAGARYIFARERFLHRESGGAEMQALGVCPSLLSLLKKPSTDTLAVHPLPRDWAEALERLSAAGRWEPEGADWKKDILASAAPSGVEDHPVPDPQHLQHSLALAEAGDGWDETRTPSIP